MNPDKLFDYLDGRLSPADRAAVEEKLLADPQLRKQFQIARGIHRTGGASREVILPAEPIGGARGSKLGRQILTAAFALVVLNVAGGLAIIGWKFNKNTASRRQEAPIRQQIEQSLGAAGAKALPPPTLADDEISLSAPRAQWDQLATQVVAAAQASGGFAPREDREDAVIVAASIPRERVAEFRKRVLGPNANATTPTGTGETATIQVRIAESAR